MTHDTTNVLAFFSGASGHVIISKNGTRSPTFYINGLSLKDETIPFAKVFVSGTNTVSLMLILLATVKHAPRNVSVSRQFSIKYICAQCEHLGVLITGKETI